MKCSDVKHIIDQVRDREIPEDALCIAFDHINECDSCREYLEEAQTLTQLMETCRITEKPDDDLFMKFEENLEKDVSRSFDWDSFIHSVNFRRAMVATMTLVVLILAGTAYYSFSLANNESMADKKLEASLKRLPDGAILMKTSDGEEIIFIDPALEADGKLDDVLKELEEVMGDDSTDSSEEFYFVTHE